MNKSFYELVKKVRRNQKSYFATMDKTFLAEVLRPMEEELDRRLKTERPTLPTALQFRKAVWDMRGWQNISCFIVNSFFMSIPPFCCFSVQR